MKRILELIKIQKLENEIWNKFIDAKFKSEFPPMSLNTFYYINAVQVEKDDGVLRCQITRDQLDKVLAERGERIVSKYNMDGII